MAKSFRVKLQRSLIGCTQVQKDVVRCLGLRRINHEVKLADNPSTRGQIMKVQHLLKVTVEK